MKNLNLNYQTFKQADINDLVTKSKSGDERAFGNLAQIVYDLAFGYFESKFRLGKIANLEDAEDLAQNVYIAFQGQFAEIENIEYWLRRVLFLNFINFYKKSKSHQFYDLEDVLRKKKVSEDHGSGFDVQKILSVLKTFSQEKQIVMKMRIYDDLSFPEIAEELNKSVDAIKKIFYRTVEEIQRTLKE